MPEQDKLLNLHYETFSKQDNSTKLDTLFVMMQDIGANHRLHCREQQKSCRSRFDGLENRAKWDKLYAAIGGGIAAVAVMLSKMFWLGGD